MLDHKTYTNILILPVIMAGVFIIHYNLLTPKPGNILYYSYLANLLLALSIYGLIALFSKKYLYLSGFLFMGGSLLKFAVFFIFFYPVFHKNGKIETHEALYFLIPYFIGLIWETYYLLKKLNSGEWNTNTPPPKKTS